MRQLCILFYTGCFLRHGGSTRVHELAGNCVRQKCQDTHPNQADYNVIGHDLYHCCSLPCIIESELTQATDPSY